MPGKKRVLVAMSGGVDSSVAAYLLQREGYDVVGATMYLYDAGSAPAAPQSRCCGLADIQDAQTVCRRLGIPHRALDYRAAFEADVIDKFVRTYQAGATPNPCIDCNRYLKFGLLLEDALEMGCDFLATGHYARVRRRADGAWELARGLDPAKEQSYVLYSLGQEELAHVVLPLGGLFKERDVRRIAAEQGFVNAAKPDSQNICFVPDDDYPGFLERRTGRRLAPGDILNEAGEVVGRHAGAMRFTPGQRKGLGVAAAHPLYVKNIDVEANTVTVAENERLFASALVADDWAWSAPAAEMEAALDAAGATGLPVTAKVRYHQPDQAARLSWADADAGGTPAAGGGRGGHLDRALRLDFDDPQRAIAPGQAVVVYRGDVVLGGGTTARVI